MILLLLPRRSESWWKFNKIRIYLFLEREKKKLKEDPTIYYITISLVIFNITYIQLDFDHVQIDTRFIWIQDNPIVCILWIHTHAKLAVTWTDCTIYESDRRNFISIELLPSNCPSPPFVPAFLHKYRICLLSLSPYPVYYHIITHR